MISCKEIAASRAYLSENYFKTEKEIKVEENATPGNDRHH